MWPRLRESIAAFLRISRWTVRLVATSETEQEEKPEAKTGGGCDRNEGLQWVWYDDNKGRTHHSRSLATPRCSNAAATQVLQMASLGAPVPPAHGHSTALLLSLGVDQYRRRIGSW
jgi:hypothetical protein